MQLALLPAVFHILGHLFVSTGVFVDLGVHIQCMLFKHLVHVPHLKYVCVSSFRCVCVLLRRLVSLPCPQVFKMSLCVSVVYKLQIMSPILHAVY